MALLMGLQLLQIKLIFWEDRGALGWDLTSTQFLNYYIGS